MSKFTVLLYDREYREVSYNALAGMFLAADFAGVHDPPIMIRTLTSKAEATLKLVYRFAPKCKFRLIEEDASTWDPKLQAEDIVNQLKTTTNLHSTFEEILPDMTGLLYRNTIVGFRLPESQPSSVKGLSEDTISRKGSNASLLTATFADDSILQGFSAFYSAHNSYPTNIIVFRRQRGEPWSRVNLPISVSNYGDQTAVVANSSIYVTLNAFKFQDKLHLVSSHAAGWRRDDLFAVLNAKLPHVEGCVVKVTALEAVGEDSYIAEVNIAPAFRPIAEARQQDSHVLPLTNGFAG